MRSGPSSSDAGRRERAVRHAARRVLRTGALFLALAAGLSSAAPLPGDADSPAQDAHSPGTPQRPRTCPRCGYLCDPAWHFCVRCGWDMQSLIGKAAGDRLDALMRAVVRVVVVKTAPKLQQILSPKDYKSVRHYVTWNPGHRKAFASAVPFLEPGLFVTTARTLAWSDSVQVVTSNNMEYAATVLGVDLASGIGVVKADVPGIEPIAPAGDAAGAVWAICFPVVFENDLVRYLPVSLHGGKVTGTRESGTYMASLENLLRSNHTIPDGCLGGALIDSRGALAGMILGSPDAGITFAVPARDLASIVGSLARKEPLQRPYFGMGLVTEDDRRRARFGLNDAPAHPLVGFLAPSSPAAAADMRPGDFLVAVGGDDVATVAAAGTRLLSATPGGPPVVLTLLRAGHQVQTSITPTVRPARILLDPADELQEALEANLIEVSTGPTSRQGLKVANVVRGGRGEDDEFKDGDLIVSVNGKGVRRLETFNQIVRSENPHIFGNAASDGDTFDMYRLSLEVRAQGETKDVRGYFSRFPGILAPPVY
jgi:S1-C subfamily serine protease